MELVNVNEGKVTTTSLKVAEYFGKPHNDVMKSIRKLLEDQDVFSRGNFSLAEYPDEQGKPRPMYEMDRDGFTLLAMGFTGKQALSFKMKYIDAFNAAEKALSQHILSVPSDPILAQLELIKTVREKQLALESGLTQTRQEVTHIKENMRLENWQQCNIQKAVHAKAAEFKELYPNAIYGDIIRKVWRFFKTKFQVPRYQELPAMRYEEGMKTLHSLAMHNLAGL